jgi:hypothetical protein
MTSSSLCAWGYSATPADVNEAVARGYPVVKAKPQAVDWGLPGWIGWVCGLNRWIDRHPLLAGAALAGGYLILRRK